MDALERQAHLDFALLLRRRWADALYPALRAQYDDAVGDTPPASTKDARPVLQALPAYPWFAWLERNGQKMLWRAVQDEVAERPAAVAGDVAPASVELDPGLVLPAWYTDWDIHVQPGGVWRNAASADTYELGAKLVMLGVNDDYTFHRAFVDTAVPERAYRRIVDLGCGFGKSTWPFKRRYPEAEVIGVDLAAPCLAMAAEKASAQGLAIRFLQADCARTGLPASAARSSGRRASSPITASRAWAETAQRASSCTLLCAVTACTGMPRRDATSRVDAPIEPVAPRTQIGRRRWSVTAARAGAAAAGRSAPGCRR